MLKESVLNWLNDHYDVFTKMAKDIWDHPQIAYEETFASKLQLRVLSDSGFRIRENVGDIPTAFIAEYGDGGPVIGILGEYDALPGLSQGVSSTREELVPGGPGHGCGHNLLGTAGVAAVIAMKNIMERYGLEGTIRYYGCPAEEVLSGKTFMARTGAFDDLDCALTWHPGTSNLICNMSMQAMVSVKFHFKGKTAHAAAAPHAGRSALDAVELMNVGSNFMREHMLDGARIHYVITNGGLAPNVVPDEASVWYYLRAAKKELVDDMLARVMRIAEGAAMMTDTQVENEILAYAYDTLPNDTLNELMLENMKAAGAPSYTKEEMDFAESLVETVDKGIIEWSKSQHGQRVDELLPTSFDYYPHLKGVSIGGSTDVGDVSWITPVGQVMTTCAPVGVQAHSWQATASYGSTLGFKGMDLAAKTMALTLLDLCMNPQVLKVAREEFEEATGGKPYKSGIPQEAEPPSAVLN